MVIFCSRCGSANEELIEFCVSCGEKLAKQEKNETKIPNNTKEKNSKNNEKKQLFRSRDNKMITGLSAGLAKYLDMEVEFMRILWIIGLFISGGTIAVVYFILAMIIPLEPENPTKL